ncbi:N-terminal domain of NEFA-interacting nuclear protein NIP30-domain-containing protein, partial [Fomitopsis serialis]|uniref:N-terminal domain of NEFA-interacting nuclear protein NIP30-domain-containing protein n=1 Tax=Fomitopsis serialis TaxID=139415 RepID=UPI0020082F53
DAIPSISSGAVGSRFVSQSDIDTAKARRDEQWKAAYARLGQEPPPPPTEDAFDGRSLAEAAKQEEWEERNKLGNQFRALEEDEVLFLDSVLEKQREEERLRKEMDGEEVKNFREAVAARENAANKPTVGIAPSAPSQPQPAPAKVKAPAPAAAKKDLKRSLKGVVVKKKPKAAASSPPQTNSGPKANSDARTDIKRKESEASPEDDTERDSKRRRVSDT